MTNQDGINKIVSKIINFSHPEKVILFGSRAWGEPAKDSDVDLLVIQKSSERRLEREVKLKQAIFPAGMAVDILSYTPEELERAINADRNFFLEDIVRNGRTLYEKPDFAIKLFHNPPELLKV